MEHGIGFTPASEPLLSPRYVCAKAGDVRLGEPNCSQHWSLVQCINHQLHQIPLGDPRRWAAEGKEILISWIFFLHNPSPFQCPIPSPANLCCFRGRQIEHVAQEQISLRKLCLAWMLSLSSFTFPLLNLIMTLQQVGVRTRLFLRAPNWSEVIISVTNTHSLYGPVSFVACGIPDDKVDDLAIWSALTNLGVYVCGPQQRQKIVTKRSSSISASKELLWNWDVESVMYLNTNTPS